MTTWILVCDASRARLFSAELREDDWSLVREFDDPEGRKASREFSEGHVFADRFGSGRIDTKDSMDSCGIARAGRFRTHDRARPATTRRNVHSGRVDNSGHFRRSPQISREFAVEAATMSLLAYGK